MTLAKRAVSGRVAIDSLAGPSEVLVIADASANADHVAADLLAQAEHDPLAAAILLTTSTALAAAVPAALEAQLQGLGAGQGLRPEYVRQVERDAVAFRTRLGPFFTLNPPFREALDDLVRRVKEREIVRRAPAPKRFL